MTLRTHAVYTGLQMTDGILTLFDALFQEAYICACVGNASQDYNSRPRGPDFHAELIPVHSPLLRESYLVSYPPLTYMLKFSGFANLTSCLEDEQSRGLQSCIRHVVRDLQQEKARGAYSVASQGQHLRTECVKGAPRSTP